jgi:hypothetical protein
MGSLTNDMQDEARISVRARARDEHETTGGPKHKSPIWEFFEKGHELTPFEVASNPRIKDMDTGPYFRWYCKLCKGEGLANYSIVAADGKVDNLRPHIQGSVSREPCANLHRAKDLGISKVPGLSQRYMKWKANRSKEGSQSAVNDGATTFNNTLLNRILALTAVRAFTLILRYFFDTDRLLDSTCAPIHIFR